MKMKEVCSKTGLTERAVRFYAEKNLIRPVKTTVNGRIRWEFTEKDIEELIAVAKLRKAEFTVQEILDMRENESNIPSVISEHCSMIIRRHDSDEQLIQELKNLQHNTNLNWKIVAGRMFTAKNVEEPDFSQFDESVIETEKKNYVPEILLVVMMCIVIMVGIAFVLTQYKNKAEVVVASAISEVTFHDIWIDNGLYAKITTNPKAAGGYDEYFFDITTVKLEQYYHYEAIQVNSAPYMSVGIKIAIPYIEAQNMELLDNQNHIIIDKVLEDKELVKQYCTITHIKR